MAPFSTLYVRFVLLAWAAFPIVAALVCLGLGLLLDAASGCVLPGTLLVPVGLAGQIVVTQILTSRQPTAHLAGVFTVAAALVGFGVGAQRLRRPSGGWPTLVGCATFLAYAAPVLLLWSATYGGYGTLGDSTVHFVLVDQLMAHGHDISQVHDSTYRATLDAYLATGYPTGVDTALGTLRSLLPIDVAWLFQSYLSFLCASFGLVAWELLRDAGLRAPVRAAAALLIAQPALVYSHALQGSVKEIAAIALLGLAASLTPIQLRIDAGVRRLLPTAVVLAAAFAVLSFAAAPTFGVVVAVQAVALVAAHRKRASCATAVSELAAVGIVGAVLAAPAIAGLRTFAPVATSVLTGAGEYGNLLRPLLPAQAFGIWPTGDHRLRLTAHVVEVRVLIAIAVAAAILGAASAVARRSLPCAIFIAGGCIGAGAVYLRGGSPWADSKALTIAASAVMLAAVLGLAEVWRSGARLLAVPAAIAVGYGVAWSNTLAAASFDPAPRGRLTQLARARSHIRARPALFVDFEEAAKHFLRDDAVAPSDAFVPPGYIPPRHAFGFPVSLDSLSLRYLDRFGTIIIRRSPFQQRPPLSFRLAWQSRSYAVWQRDHSVRDVALVHTGDCRRVGGFVAVHPRAQLLGAALRPGLAIFSPRKQRHPERWAPDPVDPNVLLLAGGGSVAGRVRLPRDRRYALWLEGSFGPRVKVALDGHEIASVSRELDGRDAFVQRGGISARAGWHHIELTVAAAGLRPGDGAPGERRMGRVILAPPLAAAPRVVFVRRAAWRSLCGRPLAFVELLDRRRR